MNGDRWPSSLLAGIEVALCLLLFAASAMHVRWRLKDAALAQQLAGGAQPVSETPVEGVKP
jgi:hypothetical protein